MITLAASRNRIAPIDRSSAARRYDALAWLLLAVVVVLVFATFRDYGVAWDEEGEKTYGELLLKYYASWFRDRSAFELANIRFYGGGFEIPAALLLRILPFGEYETRHLLSACLGVLGIAGTWRLGRELGGSRAGLLAALLLALNPSWYGHSFINARDVPFGCGIVWCLLHSVQLLDQLPNPRWRTSALFGLALGLTLSIRVGGLIALAVLLIPIAVWIAARARAGLSRARLARGAVRILVSLSLSCAIAYAVMVVLWPWAIQAPLNPLRALGMFSRFPFDGMVLFQGELIPAHALPASYLPTYLAVTQPELLLVGIAGACFFGLRALGQPRALLTTESLRVVTVVLAVAVPIGYFVAFRPTAYNGIRHFLFLLPPLSVIAALAFERILQAARSRALAGLLGAAIAVACLFHARALATLHTEQYIYFNALVDGVAGAEGRYELDYWGTSLAEATHRLVRDLEGRGEAPRAGQAPFKVYVCGNVWSAAAFFPRWLTAVERIDAADFQIAIAQFACASPAGSRRLLGVERAGALLSFVDDLRPGPAIRP
jgi:4-amino-4-deoxy-L-arabinose transferase-like glycosyltransferase